MTVEQALGPSLATPDFAADNCRGGLLPEALTLAPMG
jgi:hypothetical protein